jgi:hypothetical protein
MDVVTLMDTGERDFFEGSDGAFYTPVSGVEAQCQWCGQWSHQGKLYHREVLFTTEVALVCGEHIRREDDWRGVD